jgi:autotransporter-associated beta strand protein
MALSWWRKALVRSPKGVARAVRRSRARVLLHVERFEDRLAPSANTYLWTGGGGSDTSWKNPANWTPVGGATGMYPGDGADGPGDVAQFVALVGPTVHPKVNGAVSIGEIDFGSAANITIASDGVAGHVLTLAGSAKIVSADTFGAPTANTGLDEIAAGITVPSSLKITNTAAAHSALVQLDSLTLGSGATLTTDGGNDVQLGTLQTTGNDTLTVNTPTTLATNLASVAATDTLAIQGTGSLRIPVASTYAGTVIVSGATVSVGNSLSLGTGGVALSSGALLASTAGITLPNPLTLLSGASVTLGDPVNGITLGGAYSLPAAFSIQDNGGVSFGGVAGLVGTATLSVSGSSPLALSGGLSLAGNAALSLPGTDAVTIGANVHLGTSTLSVTPSTLLMLTGNVSGSGGLTTSGPGTTIVSGAAGYTGPTTITGGTLQFGSGVAPLGALSTPSIADNGTLVLDNVGGQTLTYGGVITGSGSMTQLGAWTLTLTGNNSYTGPTAVAAGGTINAASNTALGNGDVTLPTGSVLNVQTPGGASANLGTGLPGAYYSTLGATTYPLPSFNSLPALLSFVSTLGTPIATDSSATDNGQNNGGTVFDYGQSGAGFPAAVKNVNLSGGNPTQFLGLWQGVFFAPSAGTYTFDVGSDDGSMVFVDGNPIVNNNLNQAFTVRSGTVNLSLGVHSFAIAYYQQSGPYGLFADVQGPALPQERIPNALLGTVAPTLLQIGSLSGGGTVDLAPSAGVQNNGIVVGTDNNSSTFTGTITAIGTTVPNFPNLVKAGSGTFVLAGGESYQGSTAISGGVLQLGTAAGPIASLPTSNIVDNGTLSLDLPGSGVLAYAGVISGTGGVTLQNTGGTLAYSGANSYSGPTLVGGNTLVQLAANALPPVSIITLGSGTSSGLVDLNGFSGGLGRVTVAGTGTSNAITNSSATAATLTLTGTGAFINQNVPITGNLSLVITGSGTELFSAANSYTGRTTIYGSTVIAGNDAALPANSTLVVGRVGVLDLNGHSFVIGALRGFGISNTITNTSTTPATLTITGGSGGYYTGAITGPVSLVDASGPSAITTLGGGPSNTFTGGVMATSGTLMGVPGSFGSGPVRLNGGNIELASGGAVVNFGDDGTGWTLNSVGTGAMFQGANVLQLTSSDGTQASSFFYNTPVQPTAGFTSSFVYQDQTGNVTSPGNGITFTLQADPQGPFTVGGSGGSLGYGSGGTSSNSDGSIKNSMALALMLSGGPAGGPGTALGTNGVINAAFNPGGFSVLTSGDPIQVVISYNPAAQLLVETLTDTVSGATTFANFYGVNLLSLLGSSSAFIGFTAATGATGVAQVVSNFTYLSAAGAAAAFTNDFQASAGTSNNLAVVVNTLVNSYSTSGNFTVGNGATVNVTASRASNLAYSFTVGGNTTLAGTLNLVNNGTGQATLNLSGVVSGLGTTIGSISGNGNVNFGAGSTYNVVLGGTGVGQFTSLGVGGALNLTGGNLRLTFANGFAPAMGQSFTIATSSGPLSGTFSQGSTITAGGVTFAIAYNRTASPGIVISPITTVTPTRLVITAPATAIAGALIPITVSAEDASGNIAGNFNQVVSLSTSSGSIQPTSVMLNGGTATLQIILTTAVLQVISAVFPGLTSDDDSIDVKADDFAEYLVSDPVTTAGSYFLVQVQAADQFGNPVTNYTGPSSVTVNLGPATTASNFPFSLALGTNGLGFALGRIDQAGSYLMTAAGGFYPSNAASMTVVPGQPVKLGFAAQPVNTPLNVVMPPVTVQVLDALGNVIINDNSDTVTLGVASGPGSFLGGSTTAATVQNGVATFTSLSFSKPGTYTLSAAVASLFTGPNSTPFAIAPLQVLAGSFASSPSGFTLTFNAPFLIDSVTPVLYGTGQGAAGPVPSVTLTQIMDGSGNLLRTPTPILGSLVLHPSGNSLTFVETNTTSVSNTGTPILPDGTYVARLTSTATTDGFESVDGGSYLDGAASGTPGNDFTATFTVGAAAANQDVVWVPATADGPGQALSAPGNNQVGGGYPVYLIDNTGKVTSVNVTVNYDPTLLTLDPTATSGNAALPGSTFTLNAALSSPGHAVLSYSGPVLDAPALSAGPIPLGFINAHVPRGSPRTPIYRAKDLLHLSAIAINGGAIPSVGSDALHVVAYAGDADGSGSYSTADSVLITRASLQTDTGFAAYPLVDPVIVADTDGAGFIPADAALQASEAAVGLPTANLPIPPIPSGVNTTPISNNVDPAVRLPATLQISSDGTVVVPVNIDDAHPAGSTGLIAGHLALRYDPRLFTVSAADVHPGSLLEGSGWRIAPTIDEATGQIGIALSSDTPVTSTNDGSLVIIDFHLTGHSQPGGVSLLSPAEPVDLRTYAPILLVASATPNGQIFNTELEDAQGTFILTPAPTNSFDPRIDGLVSQLVQPVSALAGSTLFEHATPAAPVSTQKTEPDNMEPVTGTTEIDRPALAGESGGHEIIPVANESLKPPAGAIPTIAAINLVSPVIAGPTYPIAKMLTASAGVLTSQYLADQAFPLLDRCISNAIALTDGLLPARSMLHHGDSLDTDELEGDFISNEAAYFSSRIGALHPSEASAPQAEATTTAIDLVFAEELALVGQTGEDD